MDIDHADEIRHDEEADPVAPASTPMTAAATSTAHASGGGRRLIPFALLGIMTVGAGLGAFFAVWGNTTPSEAVASALTNSLQFKSAAVTISVAVGESGGTAAITSKGVTNFDTAATSEHLLIVSGKEHIREQIINDGHKVYVHLDGGAIAKVVAGKSWVSLPNGQSTAGSSTIGGAGTNSAAILRVLSAAGNDVSDQGSSKVNGSNVHLFAVHLTRSQIKRDIAGEHLPDDTRQALALIHIPAITYTLAINGANQLTQTKADVRLQVAGQQITEQVTEGYSHYGTKVTVVAPPSHEVIPYQRFVQIAQEKDDHVTI